MGYSLKNLVLVSDANGAYIDTILETGLYNIKMIIVPYKENVEFLKNKYKSRIQKYLYYVPDKNSEFQSIFKSDYNLTYDDIEQYRSTQLKIFRYNSRFIVDDNINNSIYYTALKFFLGYFSNNQIDIVVSKIMEHGSISDSLVFDVAKNNNIPVYIFSSNSGFEDDDLISLLNYNSKQFINVYNIDRDNNKSSNSINCLISTLSKNYSNNKLINFPFSKLLTKFKLKKSKTFQQCIKWIYNNKIKYYFKYINKTKISDLYKIREETSLMQIFKGHFYFKKIKKYYKKHSVSVIADNCEKYIFYPLHMEPEASILARTTLNNQLFIIEQLSQLLPKGCYLYVKEHPDQFNGVQMDKYMHKSIKNFRNIDFYKRLTNINNVRLIKLSKSSSSLIKNSLAVISIAGSALIEAVALKKPIIVLGNGCSFIEKLKDALTVNCTNDLKIAIDKINNNYQPNYNDLSEIAKKYVISTNIKSKYRIDPVNYKLFEMMYSIA